MERYEIDLKSGKRLHCINNGEGRVFGLLEVLADGKARAWVQTWVDEYRPTETVYPGPISLIRAFRTGAV